MKTTIEIADPVLDRARQRAQEQHTTLRAIVDEALRAFLDDRPVQPKFKLRDASFKGEGEGLAPEFANATWDQWLEVLYGEETRRAASR